MCESVRSTQLSRGRKRAKQILAMRVRIPAALCSTSFEPATLPSAASASSSNRRQTQRSAQDPTVRQSDRPPAVRPIVSHFCFASAFPPPPERSQKKRSHDGASTGKGRGRARAERRRPERAQKGNVDGRRRRMRTSARHTDRPTTQPADGPQIPARPAVAPRGVGSRPAPPRTRGCGSAARPAPARVPPGGAADEVRDARSSSVERGRPDAGREGRCVSPKLAPAALLKGMGLVKCGAAVCRAWRLPHASLCPARRHIKRTASERRRRWGG